MRRYVCRRVSGDILILMLKYGECPLSSSNMFRLSFTSLFRLLVRVNFEARRQIFRPPVVLFTAVHVFFALSGRSYFSKGSVSWRYTSYEEQTIRVTRMFPSVDPVEEKEATLSNY
ncbi:LPS-assembly protein LptD [Striga asiatica]|uniref:LPS-assembly protein LptD n=1 Tax=Striga asiatica TaxID=4170 RepID=A0A5A7PAR9_STRAF|nr:LPS-assembly protein LptD [Striga asiatica]